MIFENEPFELQSGLVYWGLVMLGAMAVAFVAGLAVSLVTGGLMGPLRVAETLFRGVVDIFGMTRRRIGAIAMLTFKEAYHRKAFMVFLVFLVLAMFGGWFLGAGENNDPAKIYVTFVMTIIRWLLIPLALLVSCWGLPADIKDRSLHTVVTKPVRRSEIVVGRMLGYGAAVTLILVVVSVIFFVWINRSVPPRSRNQLIARVPKYSEEMYYMNKAGERGQATNVGDPWEYRGYVEGQTNAKAVWVFKNIDVDSIREQGQMRLEQRFEAFRTFKGDIDQQIQFSVTLSNPAADLKVPLGYYPVQEYKEDSTAAVIEVPLELTYDDFGDEVTQKSASLLKDLIDPRGGLTIEVACIDAQQYLGVAQHDLFIRMRDGSFTLAYAKAIFGLWLMLMLIVAIGTSASCFLKGPVATMLTFSLILLGQGLRGYMQEQLDQLEKTGRVLGGGPMESVYRMITQSNPQIPLPDNTGKQIIEFVDARSYEMLRVLQNIIPNFEFFDTNRFVANGFDISWERCTLPSLMTTVGFIIPLILLGYFSLQLRELESK